MKLIAEADFAREMRERVEPALAALCVRGKLGGEIYYETCFPADMRGVVVLSHGFTESCLKFHEVIYYLLQAGYGAAAVDHRGHGFSAREVDDPNIVHIDKFDRYVEDLARFVKEIVQPGAGGVPLYLYGHSMGGCIAARLLETHPGLFRKAVLNAPMLGMQGPMPAWVGALFCSFMKLIGKGKEKLYFQTNFNPNPPFEEEAATSRARVDYYQALRRETKELQTSAASYSWTKEALHAGKCALREAKRVTIPVLLFQAERDTLVTAEAQQKFVDAAPQATLVRVPGSKHEIYRSENAVLESYWEKLLDFLGEQ